MSPRVRRPLAGLKLLLKQSLGEKAYTLLLSVLVGVFSGFAAVLLKYLTEAWHLIFNLFHGPYAVWLAPLLPTAGIFLCVILVKLFVKGKYDKSLAGVITAAANGTGDIPPMKMYSNVVTSSIAVGFGGSAGLEAPIALTGSAIGSNTAKYLRTGLETRTLLLACGGGAGVSAMFNSPVAGALFACEILLPSFSVAALVPLLMASAAAAVVSEMLHPKTTFIELRSGWVTANIPFYVLLGLLAGLVATYTIRSSVLLAAKFEKYENVWLKALCGGLLLYLCFLVLPPLKGEGYGFISALLNGENNAIMRDSPIAPLIGNGWSFVAVCFLMMLLKVVTSSITVESGGDGGIFAPSMFIGGFTGFTVARFFNMFGLEYQLSEVNFIAVGMGGVLAGVMHAPMTGIFLIAELTGGYKLFIPLMIVASLSCFISKRMAKYNIYKSMIAQHGGAPDPNQAAVIMEKVPLRDLVETNFAPVSVSDNLRTLLKKVMNSKRNLFPVLDDGGRIVGIVTLDAVRPFLLDSQLYDVVLVYDIMSDCDGVLEINDTLASATKMFERLHAWSLPVVENGQYLGFVSKSGVFDRYREMLRDKKDLF